MRALLGAPAVARSAQPFVATTTPALRSPLWRGEGRPCTHCQQPFAAALAAHCLDCATPLCPDCVWVAGQRTPLCPDCA